jgi:hypothetical protein
MNNAFLAVAAAGLAGLGGLGIHAQTAQNLAAPNLAAPDTGQAAGVFSQWLNPDAPQCVPVSKIGSVSRVTKLTPEQFQFVRALYVAIPPISRELPPGDSAVVASAGGKAMVALVADGKACARFLAPDFILSMLVQVGKGENGTLGEPI